MFLENPRQLAHNYWKSLLKPGDHAVDATCGNGKDLLVLAQAVVDSNNLISGQVYALDLQPQALENAQNYIASQNPTLLNCIQWFSQCHSQFPVMSKAPKLVVYNLGFLPGSDKTLTTLWPTTYLSITNACKLIAVGGVISVSVYTGHFQGLEESENLMKFVASLNPREWSVSCHSWPNRVHCPYLLLLKKL